MDSRRIKLFIKQSPFWQLILLSVVFSLAGAVIFLVAIPQTDKLLILHYSIPYGIDLIGAWHQILYMPLFGLIVALVNIFFSFLLYVKYRISAVTVLVFTCIIEIVITTSIILLVNQNI